MTQTDDRDAQPRRTGFTLVELLVVMAIILALATLSVALIPTVGEKQRVPNGASQLQGWLGTARQWALRDQRPTGLRLLIAPPTQVVGQYNMMATQVQYIQQPDVFSGGLVSMQAAPAQPGQPPQSIITASAAPGQQSPPDFFGGFGSLPQNTWAVQPGDFVEIAGSSYVYVIMPNGLMPNNKTNPPTCNQLIVLGQPAVPVMAPGTADYRIIRQPRPRAGESVLSLPDNVAIDLTTNGPYPWYGTVQPPPNAAAFPVDIMFSPSGAVYSAQWGPSSFTGAGEMIQLWLRDISEDLPPGQPPPTPPGQPAAGTTYNATFNGEQAVVTIFVRTGMVAANRVNVAPDPTNPPPPYTGSTVVRYFQPYSFTLDGGPSGL